MIHSDQVADEATMHIPLFLAHGALGGLDEIIALVVGVVIAAFAMIAYLGDRKAKPSEDKKPLEDKDSQVLD